MSKCIYILVYSYFALVIEVIADEQSAHGHAQLFIGPFDALRPAMALRLNAQKDLAEVDAFLNRAYIFQI